MFLVELDEFEGGAGAVAFFFREVVVLVQAGLGVLPTMLDMVA